jgi:endonuclease/exonuclease/phosphatase (EEP) superfamily protein YafD
VPPPPGRWRRRLIVAASALYLLALVGVWVLLAATSDRWWPGTVLLFSPRWLFAAPLAVLVPLAVWGSRRSLWLLGPAAGVALGPVMGLCLPWPVADGGGWRMRLVTCNADSGQLRADDFARLLAADRPDVVLLQAWSSRHQAAFTEGPWHAARNGEFFVASRFPLLEVEPYPDADRCGHRAAVRYLLETPGPRVNVFNLHLETPRDGLQAVIHALWRGGPELQVNSDLRRCQSLAIRDWAGLFAGPVILAGDFNTPPDSTIYRSCWAGYTNAFSAAGFGFGNTHFTHRTGVRIDHILAGPGWRCLRCWVGPDVGPAHRPVIADLEWTGDG